MIFSHRNNLRTEYSGYGEASIDLRNRLSKIIEAFVRHDSLGFLDEEITHISIDDFRYEVSQYFPNSTWGDIIKAGAYNEVFDVVEIFLGFAINYGLSSYTRDEILAQVLRAFKLSGSVYDIKTINQSLHIVITMDKQTAEQIENIKNIMATTKTSAKEKFEKAVSGLFLRKDNPDNVIRDSFVAFEDYLKEKTGETDASRAIDQLRRSGSIIQVQAGLLEKLIAYRAEAYGPTHAGNSSAPGEAEAVWYLETMMNQLKYINGKINSFK